MRSIFGTPIGLWPTRPLVGYSGSITAITHDDLVLARGGQLHVEGRPEAAVGHLHHPRVGIGGARARVFRLVAVAPPGGRHLDLRVVGFKAVDPLDLLVQAVDEHRWQALLCVPQCVRQLVQEGPGPFWQHYAELLQQPAQLDGLHDAHIHQPGAQAMQ